MARDIVDDTPVTHIDQLAGQMRTGCKPRDAFRIGTEHEKFGFRRATRSPLTYEEAGGIRFILKALGKSLGWEPILDREHIIGLYDTANGGAISIEPGGQLELSGAPLCDLHQSCREASQHLESVREICVPQGIGFLGIGMAPGWTYTDMPHMPKSRYDIMRRHMPKVGRLGLDMMHRTATIQVNLDFSDEADMRRKMRVGLALQPVATALFANSPFTEGRLNGYKSRRAQIWRDTDGARTGGIEFAFADGFGFEDYARWALDVPMYFIVRNGQYIDMTHVTFRQYMEGRARDTVPQATPTLGDWNNHLSALFPEVRLKSFIEMRGADAGPWLDICALPAFWVGLLYDDGILDEAWQMVRHWTARQREELRRDVPRLGFDAPIDGRTMLDLAKDAVALSSRGLKRRARLTDQGEDERIHLTPILSSLERAHTPADRLIERFHGAWKGNVAHIFDEYAF